MEEYYKKNIDNLQNELLSKQNQLRYKDERILFLQDEQKTYLKKIF